MTQNGQFNFGDDAQIKCGIELFSSGTITVGDLYFDVRICGKIKNTNAYIVTIIDEKSNYLKNLKKRYGHPIRQVELEWGKFTGSSKEFVIPDFEIIKI